MAWGFFQRLQTFCHQIQRPTVAWGRPCPIRVRVYETEANGVTSSGRVWIRATGDVGPDRKAEAPRHPASATSYVLGSS